MTNLGEDHLQVLHSVVALDERLRADTWRCHRAIQGIGESVSAGAPLDREEAGFWLRTFLRVFFAQVEGLCFAMRDATVLLARQGHLRLEEGVLPVLTEKRYRSRDGRIEEFRANNGTLENVHLAFVHFPMAFGVEFTLLKSDARWGAFTRSLALRNCLTHPKKPEDVDLSPKNIYDFADAFKWFTEQVTECFGAILKRLDEASRVS